MPHSAAAPRPAAPADATFDAVAFATLARRLAANIDLDAPGLPVLTLRFAGRDSSHATAIRADTLELRRMLDSAPPDVQSVAMVGVGDQPCGGGFFEFSAAVRRARGPMQTVTVTPKLRGILEHFARLAPPVVSVVSRASGRRGAASEPAFPQADWRTLTRAEKLERIEHAEALIRAAESEGRTPPAWSALARDCGVSDKTLAGIPRLAEAMIDAERAAAECGVASLRRHATPHEGDPRQHGDEN